MIWQSGQGFRPFGGHVTDSENAAIERAAKKLGLTKDETVRRALAAVGFWKSL